MTVVSVDPFAPEHREDPYPVYRQVRETGRVVWSEAQDAWLLTGYQDCIDVLRHPAASSDPETALSRGRRQSLSDVGPVLGQGIRPMLFADPPDHTRLRALVSKAFTPRSIEVMRPHIVELVEGLVASALERGNGVIDVVADVAFPLPVIVIAELLGVPLEDQSQLQPWSRDLARTIDPVITPEVAAQAAMSGLQFINYLNGLIDERRAQPREDLLSALITVEAEGERLSHEELLVMCILLFVAGHETTQNLIGNGTLALLRHPGELERLRSSLDDPAAVKNAVEEMLRWDSPVQLTGRHMKEPVEIAGVVIEEGQSAITLLAEANRDPSVFDDPDRFDVARSNANRNLSFGHGIHFCLGAPLARAEAQAAFGALLRAMPSMGLAAPPEHRETFTLRGLTSLLVAAE